MNRLRRGRFAPQPSDRQGERALHPAPIDPGGTVEGDREVAGTDAVDVMLDAWTVPGMRPDLRRRLLTIPAMEPSPSGVFWGRIQLWIAAGGLAAAAALGAVVGVSPVGEMLEQAVGIALSPEDQLVAMMDAIVEDTFR